LIFFVYHLRLSNLTNQTQQMQQNDRIPHHSIEYDKPILDRVGVKKVRQSQQEMHKPLSPSQLVIFQFMRHCTPITSKGRCTLKGG
jgi:hypothetical protein